MSPASALKSIRNQIDQLLTELGSEPEEIAFPITISAPKLKKGEKHIGVIISADGTRREHVILLPGSTEDCTWQEAMDWAKKQGGELPDRVEGALLFATAMNGFKEERYWTRELRAANSVFAWYQRFSTGTQGYTSKSIKLRARAVRRSPIFKAGDPACPVIGWVDPMGKFEERSFSFNPEPGWTTVIRQSDALEQSAKREAELVADRERLREALNRIASWPEGETVSGSFDEPGSAQIARDALAATTTIAFELRRLAAERK